MYKAYASYFVSYLLKNLRKIDNIKRIILFGSVARDQATKESDIDLFIDLKKQNKKLEKEIEKTLEDFYKSREALIFKSKGVDNKINMIISKTEEWPNLKKNIESDSIVLYGNYISSEKNGKKFAIIFWSGIGKNRGAFLNRVYGFKAKGKRYSGFLELHGGKKIGKSAIIIPIDTKNEMLNLIKHYKVNAKIIEVYT